MSKPKKYIHLWVIQTKSKDRHWFNGKHCYSFSQRRVAPKNPRHLKERLYDARFFLTKNDAYKFYFKKSRARIDMSNCKVTRRKLWLGDDGYLLYFENLGY